MSTQVQAPEPLAQTGSFGVRLDNDGFDAILTGLRLYARALASPGTETLRDAAMAVEDETPWARPAPTSAYLERLDDRITGAEEAAAVGAVLTLQGGRTP